MSTVSGYYGPGSVLAWLLAYGNTLFVHYTEAAADEISKLDIVGFIGTASYPSFATLDFLLRFRHHDDPQYYAALSICHLAFVSFVPLILSINATRYRQTRRVWSCLLAFSMLPIILDAAYSWRPQRTSPISHLKLFLNVGFLIDILISRRRALYEGDPLIELLFGAITISSWVIGWAFAGANWLAPYYRGGPYDPETPWNRLVFWEFGGSRPSIQFIFPRTGSSLRDMDQLAAFITASVALSILIISKSQQAQHILHSTLRKGTDWTRQGRFFLRRVLGHGEDEGIDWVMLQPGHRAAQ